MAIARKCDRCGKFYEYYPVENQPGVYYNGVGKIRQLINGIIDDCDAVKELCPDCMAAFDEFMKDGKNQG